jgi:Tol biopolymer transport system component
MDIGEIEIYTIPAKGGEPTRLTREREPSIEPAWSPDRTLIAYFNGGELWVKAWDRAEQLPLVLFGDRRWG